MNKIAIVLGAFHKKEMEQMLAFVKDEIKKAFAYNYKRSLGAWFYGKTTRC